MNRDKKLGLALGVLLVGIVGAFFFRNEPSAGPDLPRLENPKALDDRIAEKPVIPYVAEPQFSGSARNVSDRRTQQDRSQEGEREWAVDVEDRWDRRPFESIEPRRAQPRPEPIRLTSDAPRRLGETPPEVHNREWSAVDDAEPRVSSATSSGIKMHEVKSGETLSGLSVKYLGTSTRYPEILDANRDQLKVPKDLRVGMKIRIPPRQVERTATTRDRPVLEPIPKPRKDAPPLRSAKEAPGFEQEPFGDPRRLSARNVSSNAQSDEYEFGSDSQTPDGIASDRRSARLVPRIEMFEDGDGPLGNDPPVDTESAGFRRATPRGDSKRFSPARSPLANEGDGPEASEFTAGRFPESTSRSASPSSSQVERIADVVEAPATKSGVAPSSDPGLAPGRYIVQRGETLERIAERLFGDRQSVGRILDANRDLLTRADDLREGMALRIPQ